MRARVSERATARTRAAAAQPSRVEPAWRHLGSQSPITLTGRPRTVAGGARRLRLPDLRDRAPGRPSAPRDRRALLGAGHFAKAFTGLHSAELGLFHDGSVAPDWPAGLACGVGVHCGGYLGARLQPVVPERALQLLLGSLAIGSVRSSWRSRSWSEPDHARVQGEEQKWGLLPDRAAAPYALSDPWRSSRPES